MRDINGIEYRGKQKDNGEWINGYFAMEDPNRVGNVYLRAQLAIGVPCVLAQDRDWHEVIPETVGRYTGLKDINGKKIFEGDILSDFTSEGKIKCVRWGGSGWDMPLKPELWEVAGNIHDHSIIKKDGHYILIKNKNGKKRKEQEYEYGR